MENNKKKVLFLCTGNSARSQMAEAFMEKHGADFYEVFSAGLKPSSEIFPPVVTVMKEIGMDISDKKPKGVEKFLGKDFFYKVFIVCEKAEKNCPSIFSASSREFWPFDDPASIKGTEQEILEKCRRVRDEIEKRVTDWVKKNY
ncbi:MAG: arsenate reductase ArsC [Fibrobacterota bacterium]